jgi:hypothetical protein
MMIFEYRLLKFEVVGYKKFTLDNSSSNIVNFALPKFVYLSFRDIERRLGSHSPNHFNLYIIV